MKLSLFVSLSFSLSLFQLSRDLFNKFVFSPQMSLVAVEESDCEKWQLTCLSTFLDALRLAQLRLLLMLPIWAPGLQQAQA